MATGPHHGVHYLMINRETRMKCWFYLSHLDMWVPLYVPISGDDPWPQFPKLKDCKAELIQDILGNDVPDDKVKLYRCELTNRHPETWDGELDPEWFVNEKWGLYVDADLEGGLRQCDFEMNERQNQYERDNYSKQEDKEDDFKKDFTNGYKTGYDDGWQSGYKMGHVMAMKDHDEAVSIKVPVSPEVPASGSSAKYSDVVKQKPGESSRESQSDKSWAEVGHQSDKAD